MENTIEVPFVHWDANDYAADLNDVSKSFEQRWDPEYGFENRTSQFPEDASLLIAVYTYESYSGKAFVLYESDGKLFEVHGSHCSCYGLSEVEWDPEETTWPALLMRDFDDDWFYGDDNPWNKLNDLIAALAAERGFFPKEEQKSALELQAWDLGEGEMF